MRNVAFAQVFPTVSPLTAHDPATAAPPLPTLRPVVVRRARRKAKREKLTAFTVHTADATGKIVSTEKWRWPAKLVKSIQRRARRKGITFGAYIVEALREKVEIIVAERLAAAQQVQG